MSKPRMLVRNQIASLEYNRKTTARQIQTYGSIHKCDKCHYFTKSIFSIKNHALRHQLPLLPDPFDCERHIVEVFYCKECDFRTSQTILFNHHIKLNHTRHVTNERIQPTQFLVTSYQCDTCYFQTDSVMLWRRHCTNCIEIEPHYGEKGCEDLSDKVNREEKHTGEEEREANYEKDENRSADNVTELPQTLNGFDVKNFKCDECPYATKQKAHLSRHKLIHLPRSCTKCSYTTKNKSDWRLHLKIHLPETLKSNKNNANTWLQCDKCIYKTIFKRSLELHHISKHPKLRSKNFRCPHCPIKTCAQHLLDTHMRYRHNIVPVKLNHNNNQTSKNGLIKCSHCYFKARSQDLMNTHLLCRHKDVLIKPKTTTKIDARRLAKDNFPVAAKTVLKEQIKDIKNSRVEKDIATVKLLTCIKDNFRVESAENSAKPYAVACVAPEVAKKKKVEAFKCKKCEFQTDSRDVLIEHTKSEHVVYQCGGCDYNTKKEINLKIHVKLTHSGHPRRCDVCSRQYATKANLIRHMRESHRNEDEIEWFSCRKCPYKAKRRWNLTVHLRVMNH